MDSAFVERTAYAVALLSVLVTCVAVLYVLKTQEAAATFEERWNCIDRREGPDIYGNRP